MTPQSDLIDQYLLGELDEVTKANFLERLSSDPELAMEVKQRQAILRGLEDLSNEKMKAQIHNVRQQMLQQEPVPIKKSRARRSPYSFLWMAAALAIVLMAAFWLFTKSGLQSNPQQLFAQNFELYEANFSTRNADTEQSTSEAATLYENQDFTAAIPLLQQILQEKPNDANLQLALGNAFLANEQISPAIAQFKAIIDRNDLLYLDRARWYLALAFLKNNQIAECIDQLQSLQQNEKADYHLDAKKLLGQINQADSRVSVSSLSCATPGKLAFA
ncbi:MAG: tetratricopeptide repeat protein [Bacteroidota bacterium]